MVCGEADARVIADGVVSGLGPAGGGEAPSFDGFDERSLGPACLGNEFRSASCVPGQLVSRMRRDLRVRTAASAGGGLHLGSPHRLIAG